MRKRLTRTISHWLMLSLLVLLLAPMTACHKKTPGEKIQDGLEEVGDGISDAADNVKDKAEDVKDDIKDGLDGH